MDNLGLGCENYCPVKWDCLAIENELGTQYDDMEAGKHSGVPQDVDEMEAVNEAYETACEAGGQWTCESLSLVCDGPVQYLPEMVQEARELKELETSGKTKEEIDQARWSIHSDAMQRAGCGNPEGEKRVYEILNRNERTAAALRALRALRLEE